MTTTDSGQRGNGRSVDLRPSIAAPSRTGQGTAIEQSRAVAEVEAAIIVAQHVPRDIDRAVRDMHRSCGQKSLAQRAFFRYSRAGSQITGPSVQLARELIRCWGNAQYGLVEMRRDDAFGQSEMQAWAWDVQTNTRNSTTFIVPHIRDTRAGAVALTDMRDIYENNANMGARRLREMIFAILPGWYTEDAIAACYETLAADDGDGTLAERIAKAVSGFASIGVSATQLDQKMGAPQAKWTPYDLAQLQVIWRSIVRGEARKEEEFPSAAGAGRVTAEEITGTRQQAAESAPAPAPQEAPQTAPAAEPAERPVTSGHKASIERQRKRLGFEDHEAEEWLTILSSLAGLQFLEKVADLSDEQATAVLTVLGPCPDRPALTARTIELREHGTRGASPEAAGQAGQVTLDEASQ